MRTVAIIGGGAAGFFSAINLAELRPDLQITIYEGSNKLLSKVLISGGGRCNITNAEEDPQRLSMAYPRGHDILPTIFERFGSRETKQWLISRGLSLKSEADGKGLPSKQFFQSVYDLFLRLAKKHKIKIKTGMRLTNVTPGDILKLEFGDLVETADILITCTGGTKQIWSIFEKLGYDIVEPVPSLFTFRVQPHELVDLAGVSVPMAQIRFDQYSYSAEGPLLITHRGISGPVVLKSSAWLARDLAGDKYSGVLILSWLHTDEENSLERLPRKKCRALPRSRFCIGKSTGFLRDCTKSYSPFPGLSEHTNWAEIGKKGVKRLFDQIFRFSLDINGKDTFKEEFVTAGGININNLNTSTFESTRHPNIYFAGEVLNIDAITGGFNFQAAWSVSWHVAQAIAVGNNL